MARQRKAHSKSRNGCVQCKERHAKCDEVHPRCRQCERASLSCSFSSPVLAAPPLNEDSLADLELLEHWHQHPVTGVMTEESRALKHDLVRLGLAHPYLLNSILGVAALHLYGEDRSMAKWYIRAVAHQQTAISRAKKHLEPLDRAHRRALLSFTAFTDMYAVAEPILRPDPGHALQVQLDPIDEILRALQFTRSTRGFVQQSFPPRLVAESWPANRFDVDSMFLKPGARRELDKRFPQLPQLRACIERRCETEGQREACLDASERLFRCIAVLSDNPGDPDSLKVIWGWGLRASQDFLDMCSARHPLALVVLAHFAVLMGFCNGHWCLQAWPAELLGHIRGLVGDEWKDILLWPRQIVTVSSSRLIAPDHRQRVQVLGALTSGNRRRRRPTLPPAPSAVEGA